MPEAAHTFSFDAESGTFSVRAGDEALLSGASVQALLADRNLDSVFLDVAGTEGADADCPGLGPGRKETIRFAEADGLALSLEAFIPASGEAVVLRLLLANHGSEPVGVGELQPLVLESEAGQLLLGPPSGQWVILREGWHSWSPSGVRSLDDKDFSAADATELHGFACDLVTVLASGEAGGGLLLGWLEARRMFGRIFVGRQGDGAWVRATALADGVPLAPGETLESEPLLVSFTGRPLETLEHYGDVFAQRMASRVLARVKQEGPAGESAVAPPPAVTGWLSWYSGLKNNISDAVLRDNLRHYAAEADRWKLQYWVIDDGWQSVAGDWLMVNEEKFPRGMKLVADGIRAAGLKPGLWVAPFMVSEVSVLAREHVDWLLKDERGEVVTSFTFADDSHWRGRQFVLDVTHGEAADYVRQVIRTIVREWGFALVKADFLFVAALPGVRHDPTLTRCQVMRRALEIIRDEVGQRFLLGCGCPIGPAVGLVDACRTSPDVAPYWDRPEADDGSPATRNAVRNVIARYWQHGRLFLADPDALMVREANTELTLDEVQTLATVVAMSGGLMMWSDVLDAVDERRRRIVDKVLPVWTQAARPVDLLTSELVRTLVWTLGRGEQAWRVVALLNLTDRPADVSLVPADAGCPAGVRYHVFELWGETYCGTTSGEEVVLPRVPLHGIRLLVMRLATGGLDFLAGNLHLTAGAVLCSVEPKGLACDVTLDATWPRRGRLFFAAPAGYAVRTSDGLLTEHDDGCWSIEVDTSLTTEYHFEALHRQRL